MRIRIFLASIFAILLFTLPAFSAPVVVDLSGATTGTFINGIGADFATAFIGQTYNGSYGLSGLPTGPLTLNPIRTLEVAYWSPSVSPGSNSILPEPGNMGPLSIWLEGNLADSITWTMGFADSNNPISIAFYDINGNVVNAISPNLLSGYNVYTFSGLGVFAGLSIFNNTDPAGLRYQNFSYNQVTGIPEPTTLLLLGLGLLGVAGVRRKLRK
jgi:hypothetical protein